MLRRRARGFPSRDARFQQVQTQREDELVMVWICGGEAPMANKLQDVQQDRVDIGDEIKLL